jgi:hypothetical protein
MSRTAAVLSALEGRWYVPVVRDEDMGVSRVLHPWNPDKETLRCGMCLAGVKCHSLQVPHRGHGWAHAQGRSRVTVQRVVSG